MSDKPQPRNKYYFHTMKVDDVMKIPLSGDDDLSGIQARTAAYAYGRRNDQEYCGAVETVRGKKQMLIRRVR